jgi:ABC-type multidrug transport system fused ATPase/permease subunit
MRGFLFLSTKSLLTQPHDCCAIFVLCRRDSKKGTLVVTIVNTGRRLSFSLLWEYLRPHRLRVILLTILLLGSIGLQLLAPQVIGRFLDAAQAGQEVQTLTALAAIFFIVTVLQKAITLFAVYWTEDLGWAATNQLRTDLAAHTLRLDMGFHKLHTPGELVARIDGDVGNLAAYFSQLVIQVAGNGLLVIGIWVILFGQAWVVGLIAVVYGLTMLFFMRAVQRWAVRNWQRVSELNADLFGFLEERLSGTEDIRANGGEGYVMGRLYGILNNYSDARVRAFLTGGLTYNTSQMLGVLALVATLGWSAVAYQNGQITIGTVFLLVAYIRLLEEPLAGIRRNIADLQQALASINRIGEFLQLRPQVQESATVALPSTAPTIEFSNVTFGYRDNLSTNGFGEGQTVLHNISFDLPAGHVLGVLGRTGSGKTTLTRLLFRLYDVDTGAITLNGSNIRDVGLTHLRRHVGMVTQDVQLFAATVRDNLTLFRNHDPEATVFTDEQILEAIDALGLNEWYRSLPNGLDTILRSGGAGLSAGEAQLLAFTRIFLRSPQVVVLDEASSRLDPATEHLLERAIDRLMAGRTGVMIAHRLRTVQRADDILILENGRVREFGPRVVLAADSHTRFYSLLQTGLEEVLV